MVDIKKNLSEAFESILGSLVDGEIYDKLPPRGPHDLPFPSIANDQLDAALDQDTWGQDEEESFDSDDSDKRTRLVESFEKKQVAMPSEDTLDGLNVIGIVGDNKRILTTSFHLILSRVAIVNFRYTSGYEKPYFYSRNHDATSLMVLDNNIFKQGYSVHTYDELIDKTDQVSLLDDLKKNVDNKPFRFKYDYERSKKAPSSQSLGLAVKFQHTLELSCIDNIDLEPDGPTDPSGLTVCLKEGALFSNSTALTDIGNGLKKLLPWKNKRRFFIGISTKVSESRVLIKTLEENPHLIEQYFPNQNITTSLIKSFGTDSLLLKKILRPGDRTPLVEYIEKTREGAISDPALQGLKPVTCYYHKRSKPYNFVRLEMPKFMWEAGAELAESAISVALWQYELGGDRPLILNAAADRSNLTHDKWIIEQQMKAAFEKKRLGLIEFVDLE